MEPKEKGTNELIYKTEIGSRMLQQVIVNDPSGVYQSDTVVAEVEEYVDKKGERNGNLKVDFKLKKK